MRTTSWGAFRVGVWTALGLGSVVGGCGGQVENGSAREDAGGAAGSGNSSASSDCGSSLPVTSDDGDALGVDGQPSGFEVCQSGVVHRAAQAACRSRLPRSTVTETASVQECTSDADCTARAHGHCEYFVVQPPISTNTACFYGCVEDHECEPGYVCSCGEDIGTCVRATCTSDADCDGRLCAQGAAPLTCGVPSVGQFACQGPNDECRTSADCDSLSRCQFLDTTGRFECVASGSCGRPFLVDGDARVARLGGHAGWVALASSFDGNALAEPHRRALAEHWAHVGLMEHASVAAFARFTLELISLGAPADLVEASQRAMGDEIAHARRAFSLASRYAGTPVEPGALSVDGALDGSSLEKIAKTAILEGCIGETLAAAEAETALLHAADPAVVDTLRLIADDEARHAELAFRFVGWVLGVASPSLREELSTFFADAVDAALRVVETASAAVSPALAEHGLCDAAMLDAARQTLLSAVLLPAARALRSRHAARAA